MSNFWTNIFRYPRFFISSLAGLILVILTPLRNLFKIPKLRIFLIILIIVICLSIYITLINMMAL